MCNRGKGIGVVGLMILALTVRASWAEDRSETELKTVVVVDANGVPVPDARVYASECLVWDSRMQTMRLTQEMPWQRTDANGVFSFEFTGQRTGHPCYVMDSSGRMGCLHIPRDDRTDSYRVRLRPLARIKGTVRCIDAAFSDVRMKLDYQTLDAAFPLLSTEHHLDSPAHEIAFDIPCPAECDLQLRIEAEEALFEGCHEPIRRLKPGEVLNMDGIRLYPVSGFKVLGKVAPELQVGEWIHGKPVTLAELRGKTVLLDFLRIGGDWAGLRGLMELHKKYARDGLVIIAIHEASRTGLSWGIANSERPDLAMIPFRVAVDSPHPVYRTLRGAGGTIDAYGIRGLPTYLIVNRDGRVEAAEQNALEDRIHMLLYGRHAPQSKHGSQAKLAWRLLAAHPGVFATIGAATALILILAIIPAVSCLRRSKADIRED